MSSDSIEDKYPHWKSALFEETNLINIKCGIEYVVWHAVYALITLFGTLLVGGAFVLNKLGVPHVLGGARRVVGHDIVAAIANILILATLYTMVVFTLAMIMVLAFQQPMGVLIGVVGGLFYVAALYACSFISSRYGDEIKSAAGSVGSKASETPGIRRIWGRCPVSLKQPPKWFDKLFGDDDF